MQMQAHKRKRREQKEREEKKQKPEQMQKQSKMLKRGVLGHLFDHGRCASRPLGPHATAQIMEGKKSNLPHSTISIVSAKKNYLDLLIFFSYLQIKPVFLNSLNF